MVNNYVNLGVYLNNNLTINILVSEKSMEIVQKHLSGFATNSKSVRLVCLCQRDTRGTMGGWRQTELLSYAVAQGYTSARTLGWVHTYHLCNAIITNFFK